MTSGGGGGDGTGGTHGGGTGGAGGILTIGAPHASQKLDPSDISVPHFPHARESISRSGKATG